MTLPCLICELILQLCHFICEISNTVILLCLISHLAGMNRFELPGGLGFSNTLLSVDDILNISFKACILVSESLNLGLL
jgi:hypothetical protein